MASQKQALSAKDFQGPLLRVLGHKSKFQAGIEVQWDHCIKPCCDMLRIKDQEEYGYQERKGSKTKILWTHRWVQWAFKNLRDAGLGEMIGRGRWALTAKGVAEARRLTDQAKAKIASDQHGFPGGKPDKKKDNDKDNTMDQQAQQDPQGGNGVPAKPKAGQVSLPAGGCDESPYHSEPYIRSLAIQKTPCHSHYTSKAPLCGKCLLAGSCRNALAAFLSSLAAQMRAEDAGQTVPTPQRTQPAATPPMPQQPPAASGATGSWDLTGAETIENQADTPCSKCGNTIPQGESCTWVPSDSGTPALFHQSCADEIKRGR